MTNNSYGKLTELAERAETATGPDRELDCLIQEWRFPELKPSMRVMYYGEPTGEHVRDEGDTFVKSPAFTASLDAAMTLVPEGYHPNQSGGDPEAWDKGRWYVELHPNSKRPDEWRSVEGRGQTFALALTAAALRARAAISLTSSEGGEA